MWRLPFGAFPAASKPRETTEVLPCPSPSHSSTEFRVWANRVRSVNLQVVERTGTQEKVVRTIPLQDEGDNVFSAVVDDAPPETLYRYQLDGREGRPDPYSRFQPYGVHGPSQVLDPNQFQWTDQHWKGVDKDNLVIYELHIGLFTNEGTYLAAIPKLPQLVDLGITAIELLPLAQSPGRWNWGYDGVNYFAPRNSFGTPDELKALIDAAHRHGLGVIHDVVYNHVGPEGNYLNEFSHYRSLKYGTPWGDSLNFELPQVRDFVVNNGLYWLDEFHFDGLRLDAIHYMFDDLDPHIIHEFRQRFKEYERQDGRSLLLIAEANIFDGELLQAVEQADDRYDAIWSDCLMHSIYSHGKPDLRLTNRHYQGTADVVESLEHGYVFSAPNAVRVDAEKRKAHHPTGDRTYKQSLIMALQTHDSVGNHPHGKRLNQLLSAAYQRAAAPLFLLYPSIPMIFMGEEWATSAPFPFFTDFEDEGLRAAVDRGRREEYPHHAWDGSPLPSDPAAFFNGKLDSSELCREMWNWYRNLLELRRTGKRDGWLAVENNRTQYDHETEIFQLIYETTAQRITIAARLANPSSKPVKIEFIRTATILLDSENVNQGKQTGVEIRSEHCCIWSQPV